MDYKCDIVDDLTFQQLLESNQSFPEITDVVYDINQMEKLILDSVNMTKIGVDSVLDKTMFNFISNHLKEGFEEMEKLIKERNLKIRTIIETTPENVELVNSIKYYEIRHLDNLRGNFGITDNRTYMICIFHKDVQKPEQAFFSNFKSLVDKQQQLFDKLWEIGLPLKDRNKEIEYQQTEEFHKLLTNFEDVRCEVISFLAQGKREILIFSSIVMLVYLKNDDSFWNQISVLLKKDVKIKILTDGYNSAIIKKINKMNSLNTNYQIAMGYSTKLGNIKELILICDGKQLLEVHHDAQRQFEVSVLNERNHVLVQEILFEKYWNEVKSLEVPNNT